MPRKIAAIKRNRKGGSSPQSQPLPDVSGEGLESIRIRQHREYIEAFEKMRAAWSPKELDRAKALGVDKPLPFEPERIGWKGDGDDDDHREHNPADDVVDFRTPIDELEPDGRSFRQNEQNSANREDGQNHSVDSVNSVLPDDLSQLADLFTSALVWASQAKSLVEMGWRMHAMLRVFRPALIEGIELEARIEQEKELRKALRSASASTLPLKIGDSYRSVFAWLRRCNSLSQMGQRGFAMIYAMRRDLIGKVNTNAALGGLSNKTRQAFNKTVGDFRDSNRGFRNGVMRGERTRIKCKKAHL